MALLDAEGGAGAEGRPRVTLARAMAVADGVAVVSSLARMFRPTRDGVLLFLSLGVFPVPLFALFLRKVALPIALRIRTKSTVPSLDRPRPVRAFLEAIYWFGVVYWGLMVFLLLYSLFVFSLLAPLVDFALSAWAGIVSAGGGRPGPRRVG